MGTAPILGRDQGPVIVGGPWRPSLPGSIIDTPEKLRRMVETILNDADMFVFDCETRGHLNRHPYLRERIDDRVKAKVAEAKGTVTARRYKQIVDAIEDEYTGMLALDPLRNEVFWIGFAIDGRSWVIPMGHNLGRIIIPAESGDGGSVPPPGYRAILKNGEEATRRAKYSLHPVVTQPPPQLDRADVFDALRPLFFSKLTKANANVKFDARSIAKYYDDEVPPGPYFDTQSGQHEVEEELRSYSLENLIHHNFRMRPYEKDGKLGALVNIADFDAACRYLHRDVRWAHMLVRRQQVLLRRQKTVIPSFEQNMRCIRTIMRMENTGINLDVDRLLDLRSRLAVESAEMRVDIQTMVHKQTSRWLGGDGEFSPNNDHHIRKLLFNAKGAGGLGLKPVKLSWKTKAPSVDAETLNALYDEHPVIPKLLDWAELDKIRSTYVDGFYKLLTNEGKLHPQLHLYRTVTGRLSSTAPNSQNMPRYTGEPDDLGSLIRQIFIAPPGFVLVVFDYSQIEMRIIAAESRDKKLINAFLTGQDIHSRTAAAMLRKAVADVTKNERNLGKTSGFAIGYGAQAQRVMETAHKYGATFVTLEMAAAALKNFYAEFTAVQPWKNEVLAFGRKHGYVETYMGYRRRLPDLALFGNDKEEFRARSRAERQAINAVVQGGAAHIAKDAMVAIDEEFEGTDCRLLLQIHDEFVNLVPEDDVDKMIPVIKEAMGHGTKFKGVPIEVEGSFGRSWAEAK